MGVVTDVMMLALMAIMFWQTTLALWRGDIGAAVFIPTIGFVLLWSVGKRSKH
jgi:hypothetical protein